MASFVPPPITLFASPLHADGVQATHVILPGETVFQETPFSFLQTIENRQVNAICGGCHCFLGPLEFQMNLLSRRISRQDQHVIAQGNAIVLCCNQCGELYCSEACRVHHWQERGHKVLCTGLLDSSDPMVEFKMHALRTNEIFLLVADIYSRICGSIERCVSEKGMGLEEAVSASLPPFAGFVRQLWWDAAVAPPGTDPVVLRETLQQLISESWRLLDAALHLTERGLGSCLGPEYMACLVGMFEQNNVGVRRTSPLGKACLGLSPGRPENAKLADAASAIVTSIEEMAWEDCDEDCEDYEDAGDDGAGEGEAGDEEGTGGNTDEDDSFLMSDEVVTDPHLARLYELLNANGLECIFPPLDGTAFYMLICKINHSCEPNVLVRYDAAEPGVPLQARLTALRHISTGEELVQSYIDQSLCYDDRRQALLDYGFECCCRKCQAKA